MGDFENFRFETVARVDPSGNGDEACFYQRTAISEPQSDGLISFGDISETLLQAVMAGAAAIRPPSAWPNLCRSTARLAPGGRKRLELFGESVRTVLGDLPEAEIEGYFQQWWESLHRRRMGLVREYVRGGPVRFTLTGREYLEAAVARGAGAILWASPFASQTLCGKRGLFEAGFPAYQVSSLYHGFRHTWFSEKYLNPMLVRAENRYLAGRISFVREEAGMLIRKVMRLMNDGAFLIFTNNRFAGRSFVEMSFGKAGFVSMSTIPIALALRGKAPLFTFSTIELEPLAHYEIRISEDLAATEAAAGQGISARNDYPALAQVALKVRDELLADVRKAPDQFLDWPSLAQPVIGASR